MADDGFERCVAFVIDELEGGDKLVSDSGGLTKWGISSKAHPGMDIAALPRWQAEGIYRTEYWDEIDGDKYPWPMNLVLFDAAVNQGTAFAGSLAASALDYVEALLLRVERYNEIVNKNPSFEKYLHGWVNRLMKIFKEVQA